MIPSLVTLKMVTQAMVDLLVITIILQGTHAKDLHTIQVWEEAKEVRGILQTILLVKDLLDKKDPMEEDPLGDQEDILATITLLLLVGHLGLDGGGNMRTAVAQLHLAMICTTGLAGVEDLLGLLDKDSLLDLVILHLHPLPLLPLTAQVHLQVVLLAVSLHHHNLILVHQIIPRSPLVTLEMGDLLLVGPIILDLL